MGHDQNEHADHHDLSVYRGKFDKTTEAIRHIPTKNDITT